MENLCKRCGAELKDLKQCDRCGLRVNIVSKNTITREKGISLVDNVQDYCVIDIETTGLSPVSSSIIEISALKIRNRQIHDKFTSLINPHKKLNYFISNLTGIKDSMLKSAPDIDEVLPSFIQFIGDDIIIGHNVNFDINFIYDNLMRGFNLKFQNAFIDTMRLSRLYCPLNSHKLENIAKYYGINTKGHHRALQDCEITYQVYECIKEEYLISA